MGELHENPLLSRRRLIFGASRGISHSPCWRRQEPLPTGFDRVASAIIDGGAGPRRVGEIEVEVTATAADEGEE